MISKRYALIDYLVLFYTFCLALLMVTPYFTILNSLSIGVSAVGSLVLLKQYKAAYNKLFAFYLLQLIWLTIALFFVKYQETAYPGLVSLAKNTITAIIPALFINTTKKFINVMWAFVIGGTFNVFNNIIFGHGSLTSGERYLSEDSALTLNGFAHGTMIYLIAALVIFYFNNNKFIRIILTIYILACLTSLMITGSRQSYVSLFAMFAFMVFLQFQKLSLKTIVRLLVMCLVVGTTLYIIFVQFPESPIVQRFAAGENEGDEDRMQLLNTAFGLVMDSPIVGYGIGSFKYYSQYIYTHSAHMEILFVGGVIYSCLFYVFYWKFFKSISRLQKLEFRLGFKDNYKNNLLLKSVIFCILINGLFYMIHSSRLALTLEFYILNFVLSRIYFLKRNERNNIKKLEA